MKAFGRRIRHLVLLLVSVVIAAATSTAFAAPQISIATKHYSVHGSTAQELRQDLNRRGVKGSDGRTYDAHTAWYIRWSYDYTTRGSSCGIRSVRTSVTVTYTLPKWSGGAKASQELWNKWHRYLKDLKTHEDGHRDIGIAAAAEIEKTIAKLPPAANCREMEAKANAAGHSVIDEYRSKESFYDLRTLHGRTQGAVFP